MRKKKIMGLVLTAIVATVFGASLALAASSSIPTKAAMPLDTEPGPAFQTIDGKLSKIEGNVYVVEEYVTNYRGEDVKENEVRVYVGKETKKLTGNKKVGDKIRVEMTRGGFANSIE